MSQPVEPAAASDDPGSVAAPPPASGAPAYSQGYKAYVLLLIFIMMASNYIDRTIVRVLNPLIKDEFDLTNFDVGLLTGPAFAFLYIFMGVPLAVLSERANRVRIISIAVAVWSVMTVLCGLAQNFVQLLLARIGVGVGESGAAPPSQSLIADYYPPHQRASAVSIHSFGIALGGLLGSVIGGLAAEAWGWRGALMLVGVPGLALAILFWLTVKEPPRGHSDPNRAAINAEARPKFLVVARRLVGNATFVHLALGAGIANFAIQGIHTFDATYLRDRFDMSVGEVGVIIGTVGGLATGLGMLVGGFAGDIIARRDRRWYAWLPAIGLLLTAPIYASAFVQSDMVLTVILLALPNVLLFLFHAPAQAVLHNMSHPRMRATVISLYMVVTASLGLASGPIGVGWLADILASSQFDGQGAFVSACPGGSAPKGATEALASACDAATTHGIQWAMVIVCGLFVWSALHFYMASRTVRRDMDSGLRVQG